MFLLLNETDLKLEKKKRLQQYKAFSIALSLYSFCNRNHVDILRFNNLKKRKRIQIFLNERVNEREKSTKQKKIYDYILSFIYSKPDFKILLYALIL